MKVDMCSGLFSDDDIATLERMAADGATPGATRSIDRNAVCALLQRASRFVHCAYR
jgi:hypothetical protein